MAQLPVEIYPDVLFAESQIQASKTIPAVSIVLPVFNEGSEIASVISLALRKFESLLDSNFELIVVDDGSTDGTRTMLDRMKQDDRVKVVGYSSNTGKGNALMFGFQFTTADLVIFADGDMHASPNNFQECLLALGNADIVVSSKRVPGARISASAKRNFLSLGFNLFVKMLLPVTVSDTQAGFKAFRRKALARILPLISVKKYAFDVELLVVARLLNLKIAELPAVVVLPNGFRKRHMLRMFVDLLGITYRLRLKHWYQDNIAKRKPSLYKPIMKW